MDTAKVRPGESLGQITQEQHKFSRYGGAAWAAESGSRRPRCGLRRSRPVPWNVLLLSKCPWLFSRGYFSYLYYLFFFCCLPVGPPSLPLSAGPPGRGRDGTLKPAGEREGEARGGSAGLNPRPPPRLRTRRRRRCPRRGAHRAYPSAAPGSPSSHRRTGRRRLRTCPRP